MKRVGIFGATGAVGREVIEALQGHPQFAVGSLYAGKSAGKQYRNAVPAAAYPVEILDRVVLGLDDFRPEDSDVVFSALPSEEAAQREPEAAKYLPVMSTTSAFRYKDDVPILITEVNPEHAELLRTQQEQRSWKGFIAPEPNCTTVGLVMSLKPLYNALGIQRVVMTSYQAVSGAGYEALDAWKNQRTSELPFPFSPGEPLQMPTLEGNVIGHIKGEEAKVRQETAKILGEYKDGRIAPASFPVACTCVRVPVVRGHLEAVFVQPAKSCSAAGVREIYREYNEACRMLYGDLHSSPPQTLVVMDREPQPRFDVGINDGMSTVIGRIEVDGDWIKYLVLSDNLKKGAAKGSVQVMEYLLREEFIR